MMMKYRCFYLPFLILPIIACQNTPTNPVSEPTLSTVSQYELGGGFCMQDSIASAPMTELLTFTDSLGRIIAKAGRASESTDFNFVKFVRDESGEITLLETFVLDENEVNNKGHLSHLAKEYIFGLRPKPGHTHRFQLIKDYTGHVIEVIDIGQQSVMTAPKGYAIEYSVEEGPGFWSSCTEGGRFFITFHVKPIDI